MSCKSGFRAPRKLLTCCSFAQKLNCCWQAAGGGQLGGCWAWWCLPVFGVGAWVRGWVRRRAAGAAMAAAIAVAVALAATAAAMRRGCLSGSDSGNGRRRREGGQAWRGVGAGGSTGGCAFYSSCLALGAPAVRNERPWPAPRAHYLRPSVQHPPEEALECLGFVFCSCVVTSPSSS